MITNFSHWCSQSDGLSRYGWLEHDGKTFGMQEILDDDLLIKTSFVKRFGGTHGGDWTMRVSAETLVRMFECLNIVLNFCAVNA